MAAEWESHREVLKGLYLEEDKSLVEVQNHLADIYGFNASKAQYEAQFKKWKWRKNLKKSDWTYVSRKIDERKSRDVDRGSAVFFNERMVPFEKVKKEISRQIHLNDQFYRQDIPQSPEDVTVCTPPNYRGGSPHFALDYMKPGKRKHPDEPILQESFSSKRQSTMIAEMEATSAAIPTVNDVVALNVMSRSHFSTGGFIRQSSMTQFHGRTAPSVIHIRDLPYFQFRRTMRSSDVINWFQKALTWNDFMIENLIANPWLQPSLPHHSSSSVLAIESGPSSLNLDMNDTFESLDSYLPMQCSQSYLCKPLGIELLDDGRFCRGLDTLECMQKANVDLPALLAQMPQTQNDDLKHGIDLLLGPPTIDCVRYLVEVGVYLTSNKIDRHRSGKFISWILQNVPWAVLRYILSAQALTIQAFAEIVLEVAIEIGKKEIVSDLLKNPHLKRLVQSSGELLVIAVRFSNAELVRLLLRAGARAERRGRRSLPLGVAMTVDIARILVEAGADVNSEESKGNGPLLVMAALRRDVELARYLIGAGAHVNVSAEYYGTPLMLAAGRDQIELLQLLLEQGADVNIIAGHINKHRPSPLLSAAEAGNLDFVELLVRAGADVNAPACCISGQTALQAASFRGHMKMVKFLLSSGANVNAPGNFESQFPKSVLMTAVERNHLELVKLLLHAGADVNMPSFGYHGCTALEAAISWPASSDIIDLLIAKDARDTTPLLGPYRKIQLRDAVRMGDLRRVQRLIEIGVQIDMQVIEGSGVRSQYDEDGQTILQWALIDRVTSTLPPLYPDMVLNIELFRLLVDNIEDVNAQNEASDSMMEIFSMVAQLEQMEILETLINAGVDINICSDQRRTPLMIAALYRSLVMVRFLVDKGANINAIVDSRFVTTALQASLESLIPGYESILGNNLNVFNYLLANGATINAPIALHGRTVLGHAVNLNNIQLVRELLAQGAEVNSAPGRGETALQVAAAQRSPSMAIIELLLERGADVNAPRGPMPGKTALVGAIERGHFQFVLHLIEAGADVNARDRERDTIQNSDTMSPLESAAYHGRLDILHLLLEAGADMDLPIQRRYVDAIQEARSEGHIVIAEILEKWKKNGDVQDNTGTVARFSMNKARVVEFD